MNEKIETLLIAAKTIIKNEKPSQVITRIIEDSDIESSSNFELKLWGLYIEDTIFGEIVIKSKANSNSFVFPFDERAPFFETTRTSSIIPSETERMLIECDWKRGIELSFPDHQEILKVCELLGIEITPKLRSYLESTELYYDHNKIESLI